MSKSLVNPEIVNNLTPFFRRRNEAQYALADAMATYQAIPGLRGLWWAGSKYNGSGVTILDLSGNGMNLSEVTVPTKPKISVDADFLAPYIEFFDTVGGVSTTGNEWKITGTETMRPNGLTFGAWVWFDTTGDWHGVMGAGDPTANTRCYRLYRHMTSNYPVFQVSASGTTWVSVSHPTGIANGTWAFVACRYKPSTELKVWVNDVAETFTTSIPASLNTSAATFELGGDGYQEKVDGRIALAFLSAVALPDPWVWNLYQCSRSLFGV